MNKVYVLFASISVLSACGGNVAKDDYFPLQKGLEWKYVVYEKFTKNKTPREFSIKNIGKVELQGKYFEMPVTVRRTSDGTDYYVLNGEDGVFRIAQKKLNQNEPVFDSVERKILPDKDELDTNTNWFVESRTYALRGSALDTVPDTKDVRFEMEFEISAKNEVVEVPAGTFENCIKVTGNASFDLYVDPKLGYQTVDVQQHEWYAPGVGMVKLERIEPQEIGMFNGGTITFELEQFVH